MSDGSGGAEGRNDRAGDGGNDEGGTWGERLLVATSVVFTVVLLSFVIWQASTTPAMAEPTASVTGTETLPGGDVKVTVRFRNAQDVGLVIATVEVDCDAPPPELTFEHVPADDRRTGHVICPPGSGDSTATVSTWVEA
ncbi:hypothetical protein [Halorarum salinum]|uniref:Uncharacterized protein n=1 Tax=Halorarum salinum TaxID=2743089 RepID=A0A7D5QAM9_9EURY|nr:hypothetical protein [Halobaculum salinum]QLG62557.1 hypothetical protein HUG12_12820 [Halobaculum salinum]